jgi:histone deacetylase 1/2
MSTDIPAFQNFFTFGELTAGSSLLAAQIIVENQADIVVNWMGGFHHAKRFKASGFCYINDIVLGIQYLLRSFPRVLYLDIDVHHGDGVEEAFLTTNRVMTVSFHQYDEKEKFFPGTGAGEDVGTGDGKFYAMNIPLKPGCTDESYHSIFGKIMDNVMETYQPSVIWMQCGADSLVGDLIGGFTVTTRGHGYCVQHMMKFGKPMILVGGGGYTIENVSRCWAYETSLVLNYDLQNELPKNLEYYDMYKNDPVLHYTHNTNKPANQNQNDPTYLEEIYRNCAENLKNIAFAPGVGYYDVPVDFERRDNINIWTEEQKATSGNVQIVNSFIDGDREGMDSLREQDPR